MICHTCCLSLCEAYTFMSQIRTAEKNLKLGLHHKSSYEKIIREEPLKQEEDAIDEEMIEIDEISKIEEDTENEIEELVEAVEEAYEVDYELPAKQEINEPSTKIPKHNFSSVDFPETITVTHYELEQHEENDQNVISLNIFPQTLTAEHDKGFKFDVSWINHFIPTAIYKCKHCIKAFSNAKFLLKHTISSHLCLICLNIAENYKDLSAHVQKHKTVICHFCNRCCTSPANFRQHLKKVHNLNPPLHIGIICENLKK